MLSPHRFNRSMDAEAWRDLSAYIREVKKIRDEFADTFFFGEYLGAAGIQFQDVEPQGGMQYGTYRNRDSGKRGCILTGGGGSRGTVAVAGFDGKGRGRVTIYRPCEDPIRAELPTTIHMGPEGIVFLVEE